MKQKSWNRCFVKDMGIMKSAALPGKRLHEPNTVRLPGKRATKMRCRLSKHESSSTLFAVSEAEPENCLDLFPDLLDLFVLHSCHLDGY